MGKLRCLCVDDLTTDEKFNLLDLPLPRGAGQVLGGPVGDVHVTDEVTFTLESHGGHTIRGRVTLDNLLLDSLRKVCVTLIRGTEKGNLGLTHDVSVLSTNGNELGNTARHFILYYVFIFKYQNRGVPGLIDSVRRSDRIPIIARRPLSSSVSGFQGP